MFLAAYSDPKTGNRLGVHHKRVDKQTEVNSYNNKKDQTTDTYNRDEV